MPRDEEARGTEQMRRWMEMETGSPSTDNIFWKGLQVNGLYELLNKCLHQGIKKQDRYRCKSQKELFLLKGVPYNGYFGYGGNPAG